VSVMRRSIFLLESLEMVDIYVLNSLAVRFLGVLSPWCLHGWGFLWLHGFPHGMASDEHGKPRKTVDFRF
jgi:hypothetical protein